MEAIEIRKLTIAEFHQIEFDDNDTHLYELLDGELMSVLPGLVLDLNALFG